MLEFIVAVLLGLCMTSGVALRYTPFTTVITPKQKRLLFILYAAIGVAHVLLMTLVFHIFGLSVAISYLQIGGTVYAVGLSLLNLLVIKGKHREHIFVLGVVQTCHYLMMSVPAYVISLLPAPSAPVRLFTFIGLYGGLLLLTHWFFAKLLHKTIEPFLHMNTGNYWNTLFFIPIAYFAAIITFLGGSNTVDSML